MREMSAVFTEERDGPFPAPTDGAKLASLFGVCEAEPEGTVSFKFTAPKQPKKGPSTLGLPPWKQATPPPAPTILEAVAVHAFRFVNGQYVAHGRLGAAILGNHVNKEYKVLLYGSQQKHITTARIHHRFVLTVQSGNYTAFYDDQQQSWSLKFDSEEARIDFCKEVCVAKWNSQTCRNTLLTQDLVHAEGRTVCMGDTVDVALSSWVLQNYALGQLLCRDELQRVSLSANTALTGWETGMMGMKKGGRRLIIVSPKINYGSKGVTDGVPPSSTRVFVIEVHQVNFSKDADCLAAESTDSKKSLVLAPNGTNARSLIRSASGCSDRGDQAPSVKRKNQNDSPKLPDADKAKLISRMAKMGQPTLPFLTQAAAPSDSAKKGSRESTSVCSLAQAVSSSPLPLETASSRPSSAVSSQPAAVRHTETVDAHTAQEAYICSNPAFQPTAYPTDLGSFMMTEARQNNIEIRLAVARVTDKVDCLAFEVDKLHKQGIGSVALSSGSVESAMLLHNMQRIIQENASLKKVVLKTGSRVEEQRCKVAEPSEQRCMEKIGLLLEQTDVVLQSSRHHARLLHAEQEKVRLAEELDVSSSRVCKLRQEADGLQQKVTELQAELGAVLQERQSRCALITSLEAKVKELEEEVVCSQQQWREEKRKQRKTEWKMTNMEEEIQDLTAENKSLNQLLSDRKGAWQQEQQRFLVELEEQRSSSQQERQHLLEQLRIARVLAGKHSRPQLVLEWQEACDAALKEQKVKLEEEISRLQKQHENLQKELEEDRQHHEAQLCVQVKWVMNRLFHCLRARFDRQETYSGDSVLNTVLRTIKCVTIQFLEAFEEKEEYISAEESPSERMEEQGIKRKEMESSQSLDHTFMTAYEATNLEASKVSSESSLASDV